MTVENRIFFTHLYCECAFVARSEHAPSAVCPALQYFPALSHKRQDFREEKEVIEHKMRVLTFIYNFRLNFSRSEEN